MIRRAVWSHLRMPTEALVIPRGSRRWRIPAADIADALTTLRDRGDSYSAGRALLPQRIAHLVLTRLEAGGEITDDRVQDAVARSRPVRDCVAAVWPPVDPVRLVMRLLSDPDLLADSAAGLLDPDEQRLVLWDRPARGVRSAPWSHADAVLIDEARGVVERTPSVGHLVLDEAQDLSPMELRAVGRRASLGSATVLGDIAQGTTPWATGSWDVALRHLGQDGPSTVVEVLRKGYRVPAAVVEFAAILLPAIAPGLAPPEPVRANPGALDIVPSADLTDLTPIVRGALTRAGSVGVIAADAQVTDVARQLAGLDFALVTDDADRRLTLVPASLAKGLEFDHVVVVEPARIVAAEPRGLRRLYVVLTRAVSSLSVVRRLPLPPPLARPATDPPPAV